MTSPLLMARYSCRWLKQVNQALANKPRDPVTAIRFVKDLRKSFNQLCRHSERKHHPVFKKFGKPISIALVGGLVPSSKANCQTLSSPTPPVKTRVTAMEEKATDEDGEEKKPQESPPFPWIQFLKMILPHTLYLLAAVASAIVAAYLNIQIPQQLGKVVNVLSGYTATETSAPSDFIEKIKEPCFKMVKLYFAQAALTFGYIYSLSCIGERVAMTLRSNLFSSLIRQDIAFFDRNKSGELVNRLTSDVQDFKSSFKMIVSQGLRSFTQTVGCVISLYLISPKMTGMMMIIVPGVIITGTFIGSLLRALSKKAQAQVSKAVGVGDECISNIRTVRAFAMENVEEVMFDIEIEKSRRLNELLGLGIGLFQGGTNLFINGMILGTLYYGGYLLSVDEVTAGDLMAFLVATQTIQRSVAQLSLLFGNFVRGMSAGARVFEYINLEPEISMNVGGKKIPYHQMFGEIHFKDISFRYPTRDGHLVLQDFNLKIPAGMNVAIVGPSGSGKSTAAALLERFYDPIKGDVLIDGVNLRDMDLKWLRGQAIGYINQEPVLFGTSILENIRYGRPSASDLEVYEAAKQAHADTFIKEFPEGYNTVLGERGVTVSGGQKQRIAIARALLKDPRILILDEATSALDTQSERIVQTAIDDASKGRTVLVIAHRMSTIRNADLIAVLSNGKIVELGSHDTLVRAKGIYANLVKQKEYEEIYDGSR